MHDPRHFWAWKWTTFLIMWSQICEKNGLMCQKNSFEKNYPFQVFKISVFFLFAFFFFKPISCTYTPILPKIWDLIYKTVFPEQFFLFSLQSLTMSETWVNCVWICITPLVTRLQIQFKITLKIPSYGMRNLFQRWHLKAHGFKCSWLWHATSPLAQDA